MRKKSVRGVCGRGVFSGWDINSQCPKPNCIMGAEADYEANSPTLLGHQSAAKRADTVSNPYPWWCLEAPPPVHAEREAVIREDERYRSNI